MRPPERWPLHPAPVEAEALSSWLNRLAGTYMMSTSELLEHGLGHGNVTDQELDFDPPVPVLEELILRSGLDGNRLRTMSMAGWVPWLFDSLVPDPDSYKTYVHQMSVLLPPRRRKIYAPGQWLPWVPEDKIRRACPECLASSGPAVLQLFWQLPLMLSCPVHGRRIETYEGQPPEYIWWTTPVRDQRAVPEASSLMDRRTWQAATTGSVDLPRHPVHAGIWFRLLRTLLDELTTTQGRYGRQLEEVRLIWDNCGHPFRAGLHAWQSYETLHWTTQQQLLEAAAASMELIEAGSLTALGTSAYLLLPEPAGSINNGTPPGLPTENAGGQKHPNLGDLWQQAVDSLNVAVEAAREDPLAAKQLYGLALYGCRSEVSVRRLRETFAELEIPLDFLSHPDVHQPFA